MNRPLMFIVILPFLCINFFELYAAQQSIVQTVQWQEKLVNALWSAISEKDDDEFIKIFNDNTIHDINAFIDINGHTFLTYAISCNRLKIVNFLIDNDVNLNTIHYNIGTPLIVALTYGYANRLQLIDLLVSAGANPSLEKPCINPIDHYIMNGVRTGRRIAADAYHYITLFANSTNKEKFSYLDVVVRGLKEYDKRKTFYKTQIKEEITEKLGIQDLANICIEYLIAPNMTLPESIIPKEEITVGPDTNNSWCVIS